MFNPTRVKRTHLVLSGVSGRTYGPPFRDFDSSTIFSFKRSPATHYTRTVDIR